MDLTNLKQQNGFITFDELIRRMHRFQVPEGDNYALRRINGTFFSEVCVMYRGKVPHRLFKVCTVKKELYNHVKSLFDRAADTLEKPSTSEEWQD